MGFRWGQNCHNISSMKKTLNDHFLFRLQYNCLVFSSNIQDWQRSCQRFFDILIWFCGEDLLCQFSHGRLPSIWLVGQHSDLNGTIRTQAFGLLKKATRPCRHCSRPNLITVSLSSHAFITLRPQPKPWCHAGSVFHLLFLQ